TWSGKLYCSPRPGKGERKMSVVWADAESPIRVIITDSATDKAFAFTEPAKDARQGKTVYFELAEKVTPLPYQKKADDRHSWAFEKVVDYARILAGDKKIENK